MDGNDPKVRNEEISKEDEEMVDSNPELEVVKAQPVSPLHEPISNDASTAI